MQLNILFNPHLRIFKKCIFRERGEGGKRGRNNDERKEHQR